MTIAQAIQSFDADRGNNLPFENKIRWLSELDYKISADLLEVRNGEKFGGYTLETPHDTKLLADERFCEIYSYWLNMKLDYLNGEIVRLNNSTLIFNRLYKEMSDYINRSTPIPQKNKIKAGDIIV